MANHQRFIDFIFQYTEIQLHTDDKHKKDQSHLTQQFKIGKRVYRKKEMKSIRKEKAEYGRS